VLDLNDFFYFVQVVIAAGSQPQAGAANSKIPTLSHRIQQLETTRVRLLNRTSRRLP